MISIVLLASGPAAASSVSAEPTRLLRFPDIHGDRVVFSYGGDIWSAPATGGTAARLTSHPGLEMFAKFSPDGSRIAFTAQYGGDEQVYVMPASGGLAKQLTFYPASGPRADRWGYDNEVYGWTPDGNAILFRSMRDGFIYTKAKLYTVPADGGMPVPLPMVESGAGDFSADGKQIVYSPLWRDFRTWKRYQGGWAQDLWIFNIEKPALTRVTQHPRTDRDPMWIGAAIWFVSDRDGTLNLYKYDIAASTTTKVTRHKDADVRWASADSNSGRIVYELNGVLHVHDTRSGEDREISIFVPDDGASRRPERVKVADKIEQFSIAPGAERLVFAARGDLFTVPAKEGITRNLTQSSTAHDREGAWSRDGKQLAFVSDRSGEEEIWIVPHDGSQPARQLTHNSRWRYFAPRWSPDGAHIAVADHRGKLLIVAVKDGRITEVADDSFEFASDHDWSPDGKFLAYSLSYRSTMRTVFVYSLADRKSQRVSPDLFNAASPAWDLKGELLYFLSVREFQPQMSQIEWSFATNRGTGIFAMALNRQSANPFAPKNDEIGVPSGRKPAAKPAGEKGQDATDKPELLPKVTIDFEGIESRAIRVPIDADEYNGLAITEEAILTVKTDARYYGRDGAVKPTLLAYSIEKRKPQTIAEDVKAWSFAPGAKKVAVALANGQHKVLEIAGDNKDVEPVNLSGLALVRVPSEEWATIFDEAWRRFRDHFYVQNMHGYDWPKIREKYAALLPYVASRSDLNYVIGEMIAELNVSHAYIQGGDMRLPPRLGVALGGARFELDRASNRYRISTIFAGQNEEERYRSPLTEVGVDVKPGEYLLAINGRELHSEQNPWELMAGEPGQLAEWRVAATADGRNARTVRFRPRTSETDLIYLAWVRSNRDAITRATQGRVGYIHIPDMGENGIREFIKWWYPQLDKQAMIVDVRGNGGGNISAMLIERLSRQLRGVMFGRSQASAFTYPSEVFSGPMVALINETSASDGDIFSFQFRNAGLGPLIGKRTWGGVVGISDYGKLLDGGDVFVPEFGTADAKGQWAVEGQGVTPDIEVEQNPIEVMAGRDPQLERAIAEVLKRLETWPVHMPTRPADPVKLN